MMFVEKGADGLYLVGSGTVSGVTYRVEKVKGVWICNCKGFRLSCASRGTNCKHIREVFWKYPELDPELYPELIPHQDVRTVNALGEEITV